MNVGPRTVNSHGMPTGVQPAEGHPEVTVPPSFHSQHRTTRQERLPQWCPLPAQAPCPPQGPGLLGTAWSPELLLQPLVTRCVFLPGRDESSRRVSHPCGRNFPLSLSCLTWRPLALLFGPAPQQFQPGKETSH